MDIFPLKLNRFSHGVSFTAAINVVAQAEPVPLLLMYAIGALLLYETTQERPDSALSRTLRAPFKFAPVRWCAYLAIFSSAMLGGGDTQQFIYFQF